MIGYDEDAVTVVAVVLFLAAAFLVAAVIIHSA